MAYSVENDKAYEIEFKAFLNLDYTYKKILITNDDLHYSTNTVFHIKLKEFLLMESLEEI